MNFLKKKSKALEHFTIFKEMVENETELKIKTLRSDNGGEFTSNELWNYCEKVQLIVTTATENMSLEKRKRYPESGSFFVSQTKFDSCDQPHRFDINDLH